MRYSKSWTDVYKEVQEQTGVRKVDFVDGITPELEEKKSDYEDQIKAFLAKGGKIQKGNKPDQKKIDKVTKGFLKKYGAMKKKEADLDAKDREELEKMMGEEMALDEHCGECGAEGLQEADYELYHKTFSAAMQHAYAHAKKRGFIVDPDEIDNKVATGPRKPSSGKTNKYILGTNKKQKLHVQVANLDNKRYELNMYIEGVEESAALQMKMAADDIETYAKKHGGIDKKDMMKAASMLKKGDKKGALKFIKNLDTDPRDYLLKTMGEEVELDEKADKKTKDRLKMFKKLRDKKASQGFQKTDLANVEQKKLDPVGQADADIDNDGDVDSSDKYLKNRRKKISQAIKKDESKLYSHVKKMMKQEYANVKKMKKAYKEDHLDMWLNDEIELNEEENQDILNLIEFHDQGQLTDIELEEGILKKVGGAVARGAGRAASAVGKAAGRAAVAGAKAGGRAVVKGAKAGVKRMSTQGRIAAAKKKADKFKQKSADRKELKKVKRDAATAQRRYKAGK